MFLCLTFRPPQFPRDSKPRNSSPLPRNLSPRGRVKSHCLQPLPPAARRRRPLPGIWLGGGGGFQPGNRPGSPPFPCHPGRGSRTCRPPLCCPPQPPARTAACLPRCSASPRRPGGCVPAALWGPALAHGPTAHAHTRQVPSRTRSRCKARRPRGDPYSLSPLQATSPGTAQVS